MMYSCCRSRSPFVLQLLLLAVLEDYVNDNNCTSSSPSSPPPALGGRDNLDLHARGGQRRDLLLQALLDPREHGRPTREHDVLVEILADVDVRLHDGLEGRHVNA